VKRRHRRGFSLVEMLVALTITATLLTAALTALDAGFKGYKFTTDGASTHVVSRITMHRTRWTAPRTRWCRTSSSSTGLSPRTGPSPSA
jgi:prepilin-type N-terminal cleavage/methylation domain-containing protein